MKVLLMIDQSLKRRLPKHLEVTVKSLTLKLLYLINIISYSYSLHYLHSFIVNH